MDKKKVLHLITGFGVGGAEKALANNLPYLDGFNHIICSLSGDGPIGRVLREQGFTTYCLGNGKAFSPRAIRDFRRIVKKEKPDVLVTYLIHADMFGRVFGRLFGIRKIACFLRSALDDPKYKKFFLLEKATSFLVDGYLAVSETVRQTYIKKVGIRPEKIMVIPTGVDLKRFDGIDGGQARKNLGINDNTLVLSCVAQLRPEKNHLLLLEAFGELTKKRPDAMLLLAGEGPMREQIQRSIDQSNLADKVRLLGQRDDVPRILSATDIFVLLSSYEGMSNALLEAMAAGCAIVASDIPANRELIQDGTNGYLISLGDKKTIVEKLSNLAADNGLRQRMREAALSFVTQHSLESTNSIFAQALKDI